MANGTSVTTAKGTAPCVPYPGTTTDTWFTGEADIVAIGTVGVTQKVQSLSIDISALIGNITIRLYTNINGVWQQIFPQPLTQTFSVPIDGPGLPIIDGTIGIDGILLATAQSDNAADDEKPIGWEYILGT
jgi:hypothetical protein